MTGSAARLISPGIILSVFLLDRWTKNLILSRFYYGETLHVLPFFDITHLQNTGVAFGMGQNFNPVFIATSIALLAVLLVLRRRWEKARSGDWVLKVALALVIGGALGNLYDRIAYGSVVDFLLFYAGEHQWPAFNAADSAICVGAALLFWSQWKERKAQAGS